MTQRQRGSSVVPVALREYLVEEVALDCAEGLLSRREAFRRLAMLGVGSPAAAVLLASCGDEGATPSPASAATPAVADSTPSSTSSSPAPLTVESVSPSVAETATATRAGDAEEIRFLGPNGELIGVFAAAAPPAGAVLVIHENRGLTPHIRSIPPRLAADGYTALAIDLLSEEGGTAALAERGRGDRGARQRTAPSGDRRPARRARRARRRAPGAKLAVDRLLLRRRA